MCSIRKLELIIQKTFCGPSGTVTGTGVVFAVSQTAVRDVVMAADTAAQTKSLQALLAWLPNKSGRVCKRSSDATHEHEATVDVLDALDVFGMHVMKLAIVSPTVELRVLALQVVHGLLRTVPSAMVIAVLQQLQLEGFAKVCLQLPQPPHVFAEACAFLGTAIEKGGWCGGAMQLAKLVPWAQLLERAGDDAAAQSAAIGLVRSLGCVVAGAAAAARCADDDENVSSSSSLSSSPVSSPSSGEVRQVFALCAKMFGWLANQLHHPNVATAAVDAIGAVAKAGGASAKAAFKEDGVDLLLERLLASSDTVVLGDEGVSLHLSIARVVQALKVVEPAMRVVLPAAATVDVHIAAPDGGGGGGGGTAVTAQVCAARPGFGPRGAGARCDGPGFVLVQVGGPSSGRPTSGSGHTSRRGVGVARRNGPQVVEACCRVGHCVDGGEVVDTRAAASADTPCLGKCLRSGRRTRHRTAGRSLFRGDFPPIAHG